MWITRLQLQHKDCPIVTRCERFKTVVFSYPSTWYEKRGSKYATTTCYFQTVDAAVKKKFLVDLRADKRISQLEVSGDMFTYEINLGKEGEHVMLYHSKQIFFVKPVMNHFDSYEYWEVASWNKEVLQEFIRELENHMDICVIQKMQNTPLTDVFFPNVMPSLSKKQRGALDLAYANGYYAFPRKTGLQELAKLAGVSVSTFQEHLRKGEMKMLPVLIEHQRK